MGQDSVTTTLQNAIRTGRLAHAYLFHGARGCGKTSTARLLSRALNCVAHDGPNPTPCGVCALCVSIREGTCMDVVEIDAASETGVDNVREKIIENVQYASSEARYKVYIIDEVHDLSAKAFDALLKTLEEPPAHVVFILATTEFQKVPITIRSRCQCYQFKRGSIQDLSKAVERVIRAEGFTADVEAIQAVARSAEGSWRDALSILEQVLAYSDGHVSAATVHRALGTVGVEMLARVTATLAEGAWNGTLDIAAELVDSGTDVRQLMTALGGHLRDLMLLATGAKQAAAHELGPDRLALLQVQTGLFTPAMLLDMMGELSGGERELRFSNQHRVILERTLCRLMMIGQGTYGSAATSVEATSTKAAAKAAPPRPTPTPSAPTEPPVAPPRSRPAPVPTPPTPQTVSSQTISSGAQAGYETASDEDEDNEDEDRDKEEGAAEDPAMEPDVVFPPQSATASGFGAGARSGQTTGAPPVVPPASSNNSGVFAEGITLDVVRRSWERIVNLIRKVSPAGAGYLDKAQVAGLENTTIILLFKDPFARDRIQIKAKELVEKKINEYFRTTGYRIQCLLDGQYGGDSPGGGGSLPRSSQPISPNGSPQATQTIEMETLLDSPPVAPVSTGPARVMDFEVPAPSIPAPSSDPSSAPSLSAPSIPVPQAQAAVYEPARQMPTASYQDVSATLAPKPDATSSLSQVTSSRNGIGNANGNADQASGVNSRGAAPPPLTITPAPDASTGMLKEVLELFGGSVVHSE